VRIRFGIVGSGWRSECFLRTAAILRAAGHDVAASGIASRKEETRARLAADWGISAFPNPEALAEAIDMDFLLVSVPGSAMKDVLIGLLPLGIPLLSETPPAADLSGLIELNEIAASAGAGIQVAEQYRLAPMNAARIALLESGLIGTPSYAQVSVNHGYHNASLIRNFLGIGFEEAEIRALSFAGPAVKGPGRAGDPEREEIGYPEHRLAFLDFGDKKALFDFEDDQHRSWIRSSRILVRGERGELADSRVSYLRDFMTPVRGSLERIGTGGEDDFEGFHLKGVMFGESWLFRNPTAPARLSDEEIAQARCLIGMKEYIDGGPALYSLADASQDAYLALSIGKSIQGGGTVRTAKQSWAGRA
jgi:predicted dehydrogenase